MADFMLRWMDSGDERVEEFATADEALVRLEALAVEGVRGVTLWKRLDFKLRAKASLATRLRATKTPPAVPVVGSVTNPPGQAQDAGGSVQAIRDTTGEPEPTLHKLAVLGTPPPLPVCEAIGCLEVGKYPLRFKPKSPFIAEGDPILLAYFCGLHVEVKPESILWEFHRDFLDRTGPIRQCDDPL